MRTAIISFLVGWGLAYILMLKLSFLLAWLVVTIIGIVIQIHRLNESIAYWMMIGAMVPILGVVMKMF